METFPTPLDAYPGALAVQTDSTVAEDAVSDAIQELYDDLYSAGDVALAHLGEAAKLLGSDLKRNTSQAERYYKKAVSDMGVSLDESEPAQVNDLIAALRYGVLTTPLPPGQGGDPNPPEPPTWEPPDDPKLPIDTLPGGGGIEKDPIFPVRPPISRHPVDPPLWGGPGVEPPLPPINPPDFPPDDGTFPRPVEPEPCCPEQVIQVACPENKYYVPPTWDCCPTSPEECTDEDGNTVVIPGIACPPQQAKPCPYPEGCTPVQVSFNPPWPTNPGGPEHWQSACGKNAILAHYSRSEPYQLMTVGSNALEQSIVAIAIGRGTFDDEGKGASMSDWLNWRQS